jgi:hypothetical protein
MTDKVFAGLALLLLAAFVATVPIFVPHADLIILAVLTVALACFDFWRELFGGKGK